jgi:hypothetical protein
MMDRVKKLSNSECYAPSSESFRIYQSENIFGILHNVVVMEDKKYLQNLVCLICWLEVLFQILQFVQFCIAWNLHFTLELENLQFALPPAALSFTLQSCLLSSLCCLVGSLVQIVCWWKFGDSFYCIWASHCGDYEELCLLGYNAV